MISQILVTAFHSTRSVELFRRFSYVSQYTSGKCLHLIVVRRFEHPSDPESYTSRIVTTVRASLAGQVEG